MRKFFFPPDFFINSFVLRVTKFKLLVALSRLSSISSSILDVSKKQKQNDGRGVSVCMEKSMCCDIIKVFGHGAKGSAKYVL